MGPGLLFHIPCPGDPRDRLAGPEAASPVAGSHSRAVPLVLPVASWSPSGLNATPMTCR